MMCNEQHAAIFSDVYFDDQLFLRGCTPAVMSILFTFKQGCDASDWIGAIESIKQRRS